MKVINLFECIEGLAMNFSVIIERHLKSLCITRHVCLCFTDPYNCGISHAAGNDWLVSGDWEKRFIRHLKSY